MYRLNLCIKKWGSPSSFRRKRPVISLNCSAFVENLSSSEGVRARACANHAKNDAQKGRAMQLKGITLTDRDCSLKDRLCRVIVTYNSYRYAFYPTSFFQQIQLFYFILQSTQTFTAQTLAGIPQLVLLFSHLLTALN